ncbi:MAG: FliH/SctL family protein [Candidatus Hydrogenedentes bacterium]|nr:FliH/SctL family protein [Candidatus Hydrogenedentota bacterium]
MSKTRRTERNVAAYDRPDLNRNPALDTDALEGESAVGRAERLYQEAYAAGLQQGEAAGLQQFRDNVGEAHRALESASVALRQAHEQFLDSLEPQLVELAKTVAARVIRREARADPDLVRRTVRAALENLADRQHAVIHLNPGDIKSLTERGVSLDDEFRSFDRVEIIPDDGVPHGGCTIETKTVDIDARLDTQLMRIFDALEE